MNKEKYEATKQMMLEAADKVFAVDAIKQQLPDTDDVAQLFVALRQAARDLFGRLGMPVQFMVLEEAPSPGVKTSTWERKLSRLCTQVTNILGKWPQPETDEPAGTDENEEATASSASSPSPENMLLNETMFDQVRDAQVTY